MNSDLIILSSYENIGSIFVKIGYLCGEHFTVKLSSSFFSMKARLGGFPTAQGGAQVTSISHHQALHGILVQHFFWRINFA
jgi:hypothetical protein